MSVFPEEQLDLPIGYFPAQPGQVLKGGGWTVIRKLGWGPRSSTWLAIDNKDDIGEYGAIKILTAAATDESTANNECNLLVGAVRSIEEGVPEILSHFYESKKHLCIVLRVLGSSVEDLRLGNIYHGEYLPLHTVKKVIGDISEPLATLHFRGIVHGAVTADNFLFWCAQAGDDIRKVLSKSPSERAEKVLGSDGVTYPVVKSQPLPHGYTWDATAEDIGYTKIYLSNYAHARHVGSAHTLHPPKNFLPPEALQGGRMTVESDIWTLGCTAYLLMTGSPLFSDSYVASPVETATETLGRLESLLAASEKFSEKDLLPTTSFLRSCLAVKPRNRTKAADILDGGWIKRASCACGWCG